MNGNCRTKLIQCIFIFLVLLKFVNAGENNQHDLIANTISPSDKLLVVTEPWFPYNYVDSKGEITGSSTKVVTSVLKHANIRYKIELYPWQRSFSIAIAQDNVLIYSIYRTPSREKFFHWICPLLSSPIHSVYKLSRRKNLHIKKESDLNKYSYSITRGTFLHKLFLSKGMEEGVNLFLTSSNKSNLQKLLKNRVDLLVETEEAIVQMLANLKLPNKTIEKVYSLKPEDQADLCMAISKGTPSHIIDKVRSSYQALYPNINLNKLDKFIQLSEGKKN
ncbi:MAG: transporter substrate-binding domain-containing protein [Colwellia sp.]|nr:transporter substrate-binding domain-containing protein [Colwellia sp.]